MAQIHRKKSLINKRQTVWHPKYPKKESIVQKIRKQVTPERVAKVKSGAANIADKINRFFDWGATRAGTIEMANFDINNPMGTQRRRTTKRKTKKKR